MAARWQGVIALLLLIIISYVDRVNISVMILNPEFAAHFQLNENRMLQGMLMTCFLLGYGFSALLLTPVIESRWHYRQGLLSSITIWALVCAISPLLGSLMGMLIARIVLGVAEGPLFSLKTRFINDNFAADEIGKPNAVTALGVSLGLAVGFPLVTWLMAHVGWIGTFYALALLNLLLGARSRASAKLLPSPGVRRYLAGSCWWKSPRSAIYGGAAPGCPPGCAMSTTSHYRPPGCWRQSPFC